METRNSFTAVTWDFGQKALRTTAASEMGTTREAALHWKEETSWGAEMNEEQNRPLSQGWHSKAQSNSKCQGNTPWLENSLQHLIEK